MSKILIGDGVVVTGVTGVGGSSFDITDINKRGAVLSIDHRGLCVVKLDDGSTGKFWRGTEITKVKIKNRSIA